MRAAHLVLIAAIGLISALTGYGRRSYHDNPALGVDRCYQVSIDSAPAAFAIEARCAMPLNRASRRAVNSWQLVWDYIDSRNYRYARFSVDYSNYADGIDMPGADIAIGRLKSGCDSVESLVRLTRGVNFDLGYNSMAVEWSDGVARIYAGADRLMEAGSIRCQSPMSRTCGIMSSDSVVISRFITESEIPPSRPLMTGWTQEAIMEHIAQSTDSIEGLWHHLDRENDPAKARMGGTYTLATVWNPETRAYDILYLDGAAVNPTAWKTGMIKGRLRPTIFRDHFDLVWYDSLCQLVDRDCNASITQGAILELNFPLMATRIRLSRVSGSFVR